MFLFKRLAVLFVCFSLSSACSQKEHTLRAELYVISAEEDKESELGADYLMQHLQKRTKFKHALKKPNAAPDLKDQPSQLAIHLEIAADLKTDYCIERKAHVLHLRAKDKSTMLWLSYQLIAAIGTLDTRFEVKDLPPAILNFNTSCKDYDFRFRMLKLRVGEDADYAPILGLEGVDMQKDLDVFTLVQDIDTLKMPELFAQTAKGLQSNQFCFSSDLLYLKIEKKLNEAYKQENAGPKRCFISPRDNTWVCNCPRCLELGNTPVNAAPALADMMRRLAESFPNYTFLTVINRTTEQGPQYQLADNAGVIFTEDVDVNKSGNYIKNWDSKSNRVYLRIPLYSIDNPSKRILNLHAFQQKLNRIKENGVNGVMLLRYKDEAPFEDLMRYVAAALLIDNHQNVDHLIEQFFKLNYPQMHQSLFTFYKGLAYTFSSDISVNAQNKDLEHSKEYQKLNKNEIEGFLKKLKAQSAQVKTPENDKIQRFIRHTQMLE